MTEMSTQCGVSVPGVLVGPGYLLWCMCNAFSRYGAMSAVPTS